MKKLLALFILTFNVLLGNAFAQDSNVLDREELLEIMHAVEQGINTQDFELIGKYMEKNAIVTWPNAEVTEGPEGASIYFKKMIGNSSDAILSKFETHAQVSDAANFYENIAVAHGTSKDIFTPHNRGTFTFDSRWTATLVKTDQHWKIASLHLSTNAFNNVLLDEIKKYINYSAIGGVIFGFLLASLICFIRNRKKHQEIT